MTDEAMSPLRRRMIEDMTIRTIASKTQQGYERLNDFDCETVQLEMRGWSSVRHQLETAALR